jgi:hypothetical protein
MNRMMVVMMLLFMVQRSGVRAAEHQVTSRVGSVVARKSPERNNWIAAVSWAAGSYTISFELPYDTPYPGLYLSDDGESVVVHEFDGLIQFYDRRGTLLKTLKPFRGNGADFEQIVHCSVAHGRAAFVTSSPGEPDARLFVTDLAGNEAWGLTLPEETAAEVFLSDDAAVVLAGGYTSRRVLSRTTVVADGEGVILRTLPTSFRYAAVSPENTLFAVSERNAVLVGEVRGTESPARWVTDRRDRIITDVAFAGGGIAAAVADVSVIDGTPLYQSPQLLMLDSRATEIARWTGSWSSPGRGMLRAGRDTLYLESGSSRIVAPLKARGVR